MQPNQINKKFSQLSFEQIKNAWIKIGFSGQVFDKLIKTHSCLFEPGKKIDFQFPVIDKKLNVINSRFTDTVPANEYRLIWFGCELDTYVYGGITGLVPEGNELKLLPEDFEPLADEETELSESNKILSLLLNCLVYSNPLNTETEGKITAKKGFGKNSAKKIYARPLWIGKGYTPVSRHSPEEKGTHASPTVHWRRGHWKRVAIGKGRKERKWMWIKPGWVGLNKES